MLGMPKDYVMGALAALLALIVVCLLKSVFCDKCALLFVPPSALALYRRARASGHTIARSWPDAHRFADGSTLAHCRKDKIGFDSGVPAGGSPVAGFTPPAPVADPAAGGFANWN